MKIIKPQKVPVEYCTLQEGQVFQIADTPGSYTYLVADDGIVNLNTAEIYNDDYFKPTDKVIIYKICLMLT